jgi:tripartite ATP-independent transporter DctM subunit
VTGGAQRPVPPAGPGSSARDLVTGATGALGAVMLLAMTGIVCYEVLARLLFNAPTYWVTEIATYLFVAIVFVGLGAAQRAGRHIQVEVLVARAAPATRESLELAASWIAFLFAAFCAWQMAVFNYQEFVFDTRDWGLLATPQWIPQLPVTVGLVLFAFAILRDIRDARQSSVPVASLLVSGLLLALVGLLVWLGPNRSGLGATPLDTGSLAIIVATLISAALWSGWRVAASVGVALAALALAFWFGRDGGSAALGLLLVTGLLALLLAGVRVGVAMGVVGLAGLMLLLPRPQLAILADRAWTTVNSFSLTAVPMFVLMGSLLIRSGIPARLFDALACWFGRAPGGLANACIGASALFAAVSGSSLATAATLGQVAAPEMLKRGYSARLTFGAAAAGATLGILIPPSIAMIIYGNVVGVSVTALFLGGLVPGLLLTLLFIGVVVAWSALIPGAMPRSESFTWRMKFAAVVDLVPIAVLITVVLGSLYAGIATPTEAGAIGAAVATLLCLQRRRLSLRSLYAAALETVHVTSFLMLIVVGASIFAWVFDFLRLPRAMVDAVTAAELAPWLVLALIALVYLALGTIIESISMMLMTLAVTFPIAVALGVDPVWFGVVLVLLIEIGLITPPVGLVLFVLRGVADTVSLRDIALGALPFVILMLAFIVFLYLVPGTVLWLPQQLR